MLAQKEEKKNKTQTTYQFPRNPRSLAPTKCIMPERSNPKTLIFILKPNFYPEMFFIALDLFCPTTEFVMFDKRHLLLPQAAFLGCAFLSAPEVDSGQ